MAGGTEKVRVEAEDGVLTLRLDRPDKKNALDRAMYGALADALEAIDPAETGAVVVLGSPGAFCAGNDIADFLAFSEGAGGALGAVERFLFALVRCPVPVVAGVDGLAIGIGTTMLLHCDLAYATPRSVFRTPFVDLGLVPEAASSLVAPRLMGRQEAFALLVAGETFDADRARRCGLVAAVDEGAEARALAAAKALAAKPREALRLSRDLVRGDGADIEERIRREVELFAERLKSDEARRAFAAFMRKG